MKWSKLGRHLVADWHAGTMQVVRDDKDGEESFKYAIFEHGAIIAQGRAPTLDAAQRLAEKAIPERT